MKKTLLVASILVTGLFAWAEGPCEKSISINFSGGQRSDNHVCPMSGSETYGAYPVVGDNWNNVPTHVTTGLTGLKDGEGHVLEGVTESNTTGCNWSLGAGASANNIFYGYLDDGSTTTLTGLTHENGFSSTCTVYVYFSNDGSNTFTPLAVNGVEYTFADGVVKQGSTAWGSNSYSKNNSLVLGGDYLKVENVTMPADGTLVIAPKTGIPGARCGIAAIQVVFFSPQVVASCDPYEGAVSIDGAAASATATKDAEMGELLAATLVATPAPGYRFVRWDGETASLTSESSPNAAQVNVETYGRSALKAVFELVDPYTYALSVNFSGGRGNDNTLCAMSGTDSYGAFPVAGNNWNNISTHVTSNLATLKWNDGIVLFGITESNTSGNNWALGSSVGANNLFYSYLDDGSSTTFTGFTRARGFPATCTVYVYNSTDTKNIAFLPMSVNGVAYTFAGGEVKPGTSNWGATAKAQGNALELGGDYLAIENVPVPADGTLVIAPHGAMNTNVSRGGVAAIQVAFEVPATFTVRASCDATMGTVQFGTGAPGAAVAVTGTHAAEFSTTLRAIPAAGYTFSHWAGGTPAIDGSAENAEVTVRTQLPIQLTAVFMPDTVPLTATWKGQGTRGDLADPANWDCRNRSGGVIDGAVPTDRTDVTVSGTVIFDWPEGQTLACRSLAMACELADDCDWRGFGEIGFTGTVDLKSHALTVGSLYGTGTITNTSTSGEPSVVHVVVDEGETATNTGVVLTGAIRLVKEGVGSFTVAASNQTYTGGTDITAGTFVLGTNVHPMGPGDGTKNVMVRAGAMLDIGNMFSSTGAVYNYIDLAGTIRVSGTAENNAWNADNYWHNAITLAGDATITGGWFYFGHGTLTRTLTLNGHTLTLNFTTGESYAINLRTDETGGRIAVTAGSLQTSNNVDFSTVDVDFTGNAYVFLASDCLVRDFTYAVNKWRTHGAATQMFVGGRYTVGQYRPPVTLLDGATLDLSSQTSCWNADGTPAATGANNRTITQPGRVLFADGATIKVNIGEREVSSGLKLAQWTVKPNNVTFEFSTPIEGASLAYNEYELYVSVDSQPVIGVWTGKGDPANPLDPANWACTNKLGQAVAGALPVSQTSVTIPEGSVFNCPATSPLVCKDVYLPSVLSGDCDWSGIDAPLFGTLDLQGRKLTLSHLSGDFIITDSSSGTPGELHLAVAEGASLNNAAIPFTGNLRLVKDGAGTLTVSKANQSYTGGTEVAAGTLVLGTATHPMGTGDGSRDVVVRKGATVDINRCYNSNTCIYNYIDLAGTIRIVGTKEGDSWNTAYCWHNAITLADNATIAGGWFYFGHGTLPRTLTLNNHTLTLNLTTGEIFANRLSTDATGGRIVVNAGGVQTAADIDFSTVDVDFTGNAYVFLSNDCFVKDFSYAVNKWRTHGGATQVYVNGTYTAGTYRPPTTLKNGATLDLSAQTDVWSAKGQAATTGANNRTITTPGKVSFAPGGVQVKLGARDFPERQKVKIVDWDGAPEGTSFKPTTETMDRIVLKVADDGLYAYNEGGLVLIVR